MSQSILSSTETRSELAADHFSLCDCAAGEDCRVVAIGGSRALINRLMGLGVRIGSEIRILQRRGQDVVIANTGNRVALGGVIARHLQVERLN